MAVRDNLGAEMEKFKNMSWRDRLWYIKSYYTFHIIGLVLLVCVLVTVGQTVYRQSFTTRLYIAVINDTTEEAYMESLQEMLERGLEFGSKDLLEIDSSLHLTFDEANMSQYAYASMAKLAALVASGTLDLVIADSDTIAHYAEQGAFLDLEESLPEELYERLKADILEAVDENGISQPAAVSLEHSALAQETGINLSGVYVGIIQNSAHIEDSLGGIGCLFP